MNECAIAITNCNVEAIRWMWKMNPLHPMSIWELFQLQREVQKEVSSRDSKSDKSIELEQFLSLSKELEQSIELQKESVTSVSRSGSQSQLARGERRWFGRSGRRARQLSSIRMAGKGERRPRRDGNKEYFIRGGGRRWPTRGRATALGSPPLVPRKPNAAAKLPFVSRAASGPILLKPRNLVI